MHVVHAISFFVEVHILLVFVLDYKINFLSCIYIHVCVCVIPAFVSCVAVGFINIFFLFF